VNQCLGDIKFAPKMVGYNFNNFCNSPLSLSVGNWLYIQQCSPTMLVQ